MKALETLSGNGNIYISKDKEYEIKTEPMGNYARYYLIDNYGDKMYLTKGEVKTKFKRNKKEDIFL